MLRAMTSCSERCATGLKASMPHSSTTLFTQSLRAGQLLDVQIALQFAVELLGLVPCRGKARPLRSPRRASSSSRCSLRWSG